MMGGINPPICSGKTMAQHSGRTWRLVNDARDGDVLVVAHYQEEKHVERMLASMGRHPKEVRVMMLSDGLADRLRGLRHDRRIYLDHRLADLPHSRSMPALDKLRELAQWRGHPLLWEPCDTLQPERGPQTRSGGGGKHGG